MNKDNSVYHDMNFGLVNRGIVPSPNGFWVSRKWFSIPLVGGGQLMPDSGTASKVAIWVALDKV